MYPPIFAVCSADPGVQALLGAGVECRLYPFGEAPQKVAGPYAVWQVVTGLPENYINQTPNIDAYGLQVDVFGSSVEVVRPVVEALRDAIEPEAHITSWSGDSRDPDTNLYRSIFSVDWWVPRP